MMHMFSAATMTDMQHSAQCCQMQGRSAGTHGLQRDCKGKRSCGLSDVNSLASAGNKIFAMGI